MGGGISSWLKRLRGGTRTLAPASIVDFQMIAENSTDVLIQLAAIDSRRVYVSPSALPVLGWTPAEILEQQISVIHPDDLGLVAESLQHLASPEVQSERLTFRILRKNGAVRWVEGNSRRIRDPHTGALGDTVVVLRDIHEHKLLREKLESQALSDGLTGLANRRAFDEALEREWRRALRDNGHLSLIILDLDHFKSLNDHYGHQVGDDCLRAVARAVQASVRRPGDLCARYGGEELAVILPNTDPAGALDVAETLRSAIEGLGLPNAGNVEGGGLLTASLGVSTAFSRLGGSVRMPEGLLISADGALYRAKEGGRNRVATSVLVMAQEAPPFDAV